MPAQVRAAIPLVMLTLVVLIWSSNNIATKLVLRETSPGLLMLVRFTVTTLVCYVPAFLLIRKIGQPMSRRDWTVLAFASLTGYALSALMFMIGISMVSATFGSLMMMTGPLWTAVLERAFVGTRIGRLQGLGMAISFTSAAFLATGGNLDAPDASLLIGGLLLMGCQTSWGGYTILTKPLLARRPPLMIVTSASMIATPAMWPIAGAMGAFGDVPQMVNWSPGAWLGVAYLIFIAGFCSQVLYAYGLRDVTASQAMAFTYLMPVFTAGFAALLLDEKLTMATVICGAFIVFGLWLMNAYRPGRNRAPKKPVTAEDAVTVGEAAPVVVPQPASTRETG
ncbi:MAG: DMT family transporter [Chloroflexi bacterium]|nr:DMT family transporter [Chloroflexota bacterium]